jgi:predicted permease
LNLASSLGLLFWERILPILLLVALGYSFQRRMRIDASTLNRVNLYLFVPALTLSRLAETPLSASTIGTVAIAVFLNTLFLWLVSWFVGRDDELESDGSSHRYFGFDVGQFG